MKVYAKRWLAIAIAMVLVIAGCAGNLGTVVVKASPEVTSKIVFEGSTPFCVDIPQCNIFDNIWGDDGTYKYAYVFPCKYDKSELYETMTAEKFASDYSGLNVSFYAKGIDQCADPVILNIKLTMSNNNKADREDYEDFCTEQTVLIDEYTVQEGLNSFSLIDTVTTHQFSFDECYCLHEFEYEFKVKDTSNDINISSNAIDNIIPRTGYINNPEPIKDLNDVSNPDSKYGTVKNPIVGTYNWPATQYDGADALINEANFPDEVFKNYVSGHFDINSDEKLSPEEIAVATSAAIGGEAGSLMGIQILTELEYLDIRGYEIEDYNILNKNTKLEYLYSDCSKAFYCNLRCFPNLKYVQTPWAQPDNLQAVTGEIKEGDHTVALLNYHIKDYSAWNDGYSVLVSTPNGLFNEELTDKLESVCWGLVLGGGKCTHEEEEKNRVYSGWVDACDLSSGKQPLNMYGIFVFDGAYSAEDIQKALLPSTDIGDAKICIGNNIDTGFEVIQNNEWQLGSDDVELRVESQVFQYYTLDLTQFVGAENRQYILGLRSGVLECDDPANNGMIDVIPCGIDWGMAEDGGVSIMPSLYIILEYDNGFTPKNEWAEFEDSMWISIRFDKLVSAPRMSSVPTALATNYATVEELESSISKTFDNFECTKVQTYDAGLFDFVLGDGWVDVGTENFPEEGIEVFMPYPEGTDSTDNFRVAHVFTSDCNGYKAGDVEYPEITYEDAGMRFTVMGFSPIIVGTDSKKVVIPEQKEETEQEEEPGRKEEAEQEEKPAPIVEPAPTVIISSPVAPESTTETGNATESVTESTTESTAKSDESTSENINATSAAEMTPAEEKLQQEIEKTFTKSKVTVIEQNLDDAIIATKRNSAYYDEDGKMITESFIETSDGTQKYVGANGKSVKRSVIATIDTATGERKMFYAGKTGNIVKNKVVSLPDGSRIFAKEDGSLAVNEIVTAPNGRQYFADKNGVVARSRVIKTEDGTRYYANKYGVIKKNALVTDASGNQRYATADGTLAKSCWVTVDNKMYWCNKIGRITKVKDIE